MKRKLAVLICVAFVLGVLSPGSSWAGRPDKSWKDWFGHFAIGYVLPEGEFSDLVDETWSLSGGATWWPGPVGLDLDLAWNDFDVSKEAIRRLNDALEPPSDGTIDDGTLAIWSVTADAIWSPELGGKVSFYLAGGIGTYYLDGQLTTRGLVYYPPGCQPYPPYWCYPGGIGGADIVVGSESSWEFGYNAALGLNFELASGSQVYLEVKYHNVDTERDALTYIPIMLGYRW